VDPVDTDVVYLTTSYYGFGMVETLFPSGVYKSMDGGETWVNKSRGLPVNEHIGGIVFYADSLVHRVYVTVLWKGVYMSEDGGETWSPRNGGIENLCASGLVADPMERGILYLNTWPNGLYKTRDGGENWECAVGGLNPEGGYSVFIDPNVHQRLYAVGSSITDQSYGQVYETEYSGWYWWPVGWKVPVADYDPG
jgi:photosystem II stability/assembly factor-like uncharacterized protein